MARAFDCRVYGIEDIGDSVLFGDGWNAQRNVSEPSQTQVLEPR